MGAGRVQAKEAHCAESKRLCQRDVAEANRLVVICYSCPSFNRAVDKALIESFNVGKGKQVVIQNPSLTRDMFKRPMGITGGSPAVVEEDNLEQFHIPPYLF